MQNSNTNKVIIVAIMSTLLIASVAIFLMLPAESTEPANKNDSSAPEPEVKPDTGVIGDGPEILPPPPPNPLQPQPQPSTNPPSQSKPAAEDAGNEESSDEEEEEEEEPKPEIQDIEPPKKTGSLNTPTKTYSEKLEIDPKTGTETETETDTDTDTGTGAHKTGNAEDHKDKDQIQFLGGNMFSDDGFFAIHRFGSAWLFEVSNRRNAILTIDEVPVHSYLADADSTEKIFKKINLPPKGKLLKLHNDYFFRNFKIHDKNYFVKIDCPSDDRNVEPEVIMKAVAEMVAKADSDGELLDLFESYIKPNLSLFSEKSPFKLDKADLSALILVETGESGNFMNNVKTLPDEVEVKIPDVKVEIAVEKNEDKYNFKAPFNFKFIKGGMFSKDGIYTVSQVEANGRKAIYFEISKREDSIIKTIESEDYPLCVDDGDLYMYRTITDATSPSEESITDLINSPDSYTLEEVNEKYLCSTFFKGKGLKWTKEDIISGITNIISTNTNKMFGGFKKLVTGGILKAFDLSNPEINVQILLILPDKFKPLEAGPEPDDSITSSVMSYFTQNSAVENITGFQIATKEGATDPKHLNLIGGEMTSNDTFCAIYKLNNTDYGNNSRFDIAHYFKVAMLPETAEVDEKDKIIQIDMPSKEQIEDLLRKIDVSKDVTVGNKVYSVVIKGSGMNIKNLLIDFWSDYFSYSIEDIQNAVIGAVSKSKDQIFEDFVAFVKGKKSSTGLFKPFDLDSKYLDIEILVIETLKIKKDTVNDGNFGDDDGFCTMLEKAESENKDNVLKPKNNSVSATHTNPSAAFKDGNGPENNIPTEFTDVEYLVAEVYSTENNLYYSLLGFKYEGKKHFYFEMGKLDNSQRTIIKSDDGSSALITENLCPSKEEIDFIKLIHESEQEVEKDDDKYEVYFKGTSVNWGYSYADVAKGMVDVINRKDVSAALKEYINPTFSLRTPFHLTQPDIKVLIVKKN